MKKILALVLLLCSLFPCFSAEDFIPLKYIPTNIEVEVLNVDVVIIASDESVASYNTELAPGKKLSCVLNRGTFRIRSVYETSGRITIKIPKTAKIERLLIVAGLSNITVRNMTVVHSNILLTRGDMHIADCSFKTSVLTHNSGTMKLSAGIKSSMLCLSNVRAELCYLGEVNDYNIEYTQANSLFSINGESVNALQGQVGRQNAIKRALLSVSASVINMTYPKAQLTKAK